MRVKFHRDYDHRWPSGAFTAFKAGWSGLVKRSAGEAAVAKRRATVIPEDATPPSDADGQPDSLGGFNSGQADIPSTGGDRGRHRGDSDGARPAVGRDKPAKPRK